MNGYLPWLLLASLLTTVLVTSVLKRAQRSPAAAWWLVIGWVGIIAWMRAHQIIQTPHLWVLYGAMVSLNYLLTFVVAAFLYHDPAEDVGQLATLTQKMRVHYVIPVFNEPRFVVRCVDSVIKAADFVSDIADVTIVIVDDASTDNTKDVLDQHYANLPGVQVMHLSKNAGKKGALTAGSYGGENWRDGFVLFQQRYGRNPTRYDFSQLQACLQEVGCLADEYDLYLHTDSDSIVSETFIRQQIMAFLSDPQIGAVSGHCDVWLGDEKQSFVTRMQVAWYSTQFRVRKASESAFSAVFCVSGPGAGFAAKAVFHLLPWWVDDVFGDRIYRGATDRKLTLLILQQGWKVVYSERAKVQTVVPQNFDELRKQWTRWKQNFWRMLIPVWQYAWKVHPVAAFLTYSRLLVTILAPFIFAYHLVWFLLGGFVDSALYVAGIAMMGSLMGMAYAIKNPDGRAFALLRPFISLTSAFWGSMLTLRALQLTLRGSFIWREAQKKPSRGRLINRWFIPTFELRFLEVVLIVTALLALWQRFAK